MTHTSPPTLAQIRERDRQELATYNSNALRQQMPPIERWSVPASIDRRELLRLLDEAHSQIDGLMKRLLREEQDARRYRWIIDRPHIGIAMCWILPRDSVADTRVDYEAAIDSAMTSQGGGDG